MSKRIYSSPKIVENFISTDMAAPLAIFSAATAAAAVAGLAAGAVGAAKILGDDRSIRKSLSSKEIIGLMK